MGRLISNYSLPRGSAHGLSQNQATWWLINSEPVAPGGGAAPTAPKFRSLLLPGKSCCILKTSAGKSTQTEAGAGAPGAGVTGVSVPWGRSVWWRWEKVSGVEGSDQRRFQGARCIRCRRVAGPRAGAATGAIGRPLYRSEKNKPVLGKSLLRSAAASSRRPHLPSREEILPLPQATRVSSPPVQTQWPFRAVTNPRQQDLARDRRELGTHERAEPGTSQGGSGTPGGFSGARSSSSEATGTASE